MEEIIRIAKEYYATCVDVRLFGLKGGGFILLGTPFLLTSLYIGAEFQNLSLIIILLQVIGMLCWRKAKKLYDTKLNRRLNLKLAVNEDNLQTLKIRYLSNLTAPMGETIFDAMNNIIKMNEISEKNKAFSPDNLGHFISRFIYDPEAKNRILSLMIYLISLLAILLVVKPDTQIDIYGIISVIELSDIISFLGYAAITILFFFFIIFIPLSMVASYLVRPLMLMKANQRLLIRYFIGELAKYSFSDVVTSKEQPPNPNSKRN